MKNLKFTWLILSAILLFGSSTLKSQSFDWNTSGNTLFGTGILGNSENFDILFRTDGVNRMQLMESGNTTIDGYTTDYDGHLGLSLTPGFFGTGTGSAVPFSLLHLNGTGNNATGPQVLGYRDWMRPGITFTHNSDLMYIGPRENTDQDVTDAVIAWSDNDQAGSVGPDVLRFLFTGAGGGSTSIDSDDTNDQDYDGVEIARMHGDGRMGVGVSWNNTLQPKRSLDIMNDQGDPQMRLSHDISSTLTGGDHADFQVSEDGDLYIKPQSGSVKAVAIGFLEGELTAPNAPLGFQTILDVGGLTRIRTLPLGGSSDCLILGSNAAGAGDNYLKRLDFTGNSNEYLAGDGTWQQGIGGVDCRWVDNADLFTSYDLIYTGLDETSDCYRSKVGIGIDQPVAKAGVVNITSRDRVSSGLNVVSTNDDPTWEAQDNNGQLVAINGQASADGVESTVFHIGVQGYAAGGQRSVGLEALADRGGKGSIGVYSRAFNGGTQPADNIAYYSEVLSNGVSIYQVGGTAIQTGSSINISDATVKTNITEIEGASDIINQLSPKTYNFVSPENRYIGFEDDLQYGLIAQDVQDVLPEIVEQTTVPEIRDSLGNFVEGTSVDLLGIQYEALVPILIAGFQEQNALIDSQAAMLTEQEVTNEELEAQVAALSEQLEAQAAEMAEMQSQMAQVMASFQSTESKMNNCCGTAPSEKSHSESGKNELEQNFPNPFETETTINFTLAEAAQIRLEISDAQGRVLEVLVNENLSAGRYTERWDASAYAPGTYYYSLYADTELLTKKMIKK